VVAQETGQINSAIGPFLRKRMNERRIWVATETFPTRGGGEAVGAAKCEAGRPSTISRPVAASSNRVHYATDGEACRPGIASCSTADRD
jgi:hypothetical protein